MKKYFLSIILFFCILVCKSQPIYFPPIAGNTWDTISPNTLGWCDTKVDTLLNYLQSQNTKAFILLKDGKIVIEKYFGTFTQDSLWYWASAGKTLTSFLVGVAQQENNLSIRDTSSKYLGTGWTNCTPNQEEKITIRNQLTMTSGLYDDVPDHYCTLDTCLNYLADANTRWAYHNGPYTLLDKVIENATSKSMNTYINQKLKAITGMTGAFIPSGYNNVFYSKARSMARFGLLILNKGNWNGTSIMTDSVYFNEMINTSQQLNKSYGYLWWLNGKASYMAPGFQFIIPGSLNPDAPDDMIAALGKNGQIINVVPSKKIVFIRMGNAPGVGEVPITFNNVVWQKLNDIMCNTTTGDNKIKGKNQLLIYPNPSNGVTTIELQDEVFNIELFNAWGQQVFQKEKCFNKQILNTQQFKKGIYLVRVKSNTSFYTSKLIVN